VEGVEGIVNGFEVGHPRHDVVGVGADGAGRGGGGGEGFFVLEELWVGDDGCETLV